MKVLALVFLATIFSCTVKSQSKKVFNSTEVDVIPEFNGGENQMKFFISKNLKWPSPDFGYSGYAVVSAIVNETGTLDSITIKKSLCSFCDEEAKRVVSIMPKWIPARNNHKNVKCEIEIPIHFEIKE